MYKSRTRIIILIIFAFAAIAAVLFVSNQEPDMNEDGGKIKVGLSLDSLVVERWKRDMETFEAYAADKGMEVIVQIANEDKDEQVNQIQYLIDQGVDVLVILPNDSGNLSEVISKAKKRGIKIIAYDRLILDADIDMYISFDNGGIGETLAKAVVDDSFMKKLPSYNVVVINGDPKDNNSAMINKGVYRVLSAAGGNIKVVGETWANEWREQYAYELIDSVVEKGEKIDGVIAANDMLAAAAIRALTEYKLISGVAVVSQDAELSACQRIVEGTQLATIYKPINNLSKNTVDYIEKLLKDGKIDPVETIDNGKKQIPYIKLPFEMVDKQSIDKVIIESGFHLREDVYRNYENK